MLQIIREEKHWLAVHKPAGLIVERNPFESPTVEEWVAGYLSQSVRQPFVGVVHRLDKPVSGVLLFAKRRSALRRLHTAFRLRQVRKRYLAVVFGTPPAARGTLTHWLKRSVDRKRSVEATRGEKGATPCQLRWRILQQHEQLYLLEVQPLSGRFHQIRIQLALAQMPIVGDAAYGSTIAWQKGQIALHAWQLHFPYPDTQQWHAVACLPKGEKWATWQLGHRP